MISNSGAGGVCGTLEGGGGYSFVACLNYLTIDRTSLLRRNIRKEGGREKKVGEEGGKRNWRKRVCVGGGGVRRRRLRKRVILQCQPRLSMNAGSISPPTLPSKFCSALMSFGLCAPLFLLCATVWA